jgi:hypothetical protein
MRITHRLILIATVLTALAVAASAHAATVIEVNGDHAVRRFDPMVPPASADDLPRPPARYAVGTAKASAAATSRPRARRSTASGRRAVTRALKRAVRTKKIKRADYRRWTRQWAQARRTLRGLRGARRAQLYYVYISVESLALTGRLIPSRMPAAFLQVARNRQYWRALPFPASEDRVSFRGSQILFEYFPGRGLQIHPLSSFKKANLIHGACVREEPGCDREALAQLLDEMNRLAVRRGRGFVAWEYLFDFGGGSPPWMSGMAQATAIQALARASQLLGRPDYLTWARRGLGAFETPPPTGVRTTGPEGGVAYLQYSFAPRLYIFNAFLQSLIGLYDYSVITGDTRARRLYDEAEPEAERQVPLSDVGDWSLYNYRGHESNADYHELLREFLQSMCTRRLGEVFCLYAKRYHGYQVDPPVLKLSVPDLTTKGDLTPIRFNVSKLSAVEVTITKNGKVALDSVRTFRRGAGSVYWRPRSRGLYTVKVGAKELRTGRGLKDRGSAELEVEPDPDA